MLNSHARAAANASPRVLPRRTALSIRERQVILAVSDALAGGLGCAVAYLVDERLLGRALVVPKFGPAFYALAWVAGLFLVDGYSSQGLSQRQKSLIAVAKGSLIAGLLGFAIFFFQPYRMNRPVIVLAVVFGALLIFLERISVGRLLLHEALALRSVLVGAQPPGPDLTDTLHRARHEVHLAAALDHRSAGPDKVREELIELVHEHQANEVILSREAMELPGLVEACINEGVRVISVGAMVERYQARVPLDEVDGHWFVGVPESDLWARPYFVIRRVIDLVISALISLPFLLVLPLLALLIRLDSPGPIFLQQRRVGQFGREFDLLKLRTMRSDAESDGPRWAVAGDPRVTRVGGILRKTRLDEVPQALNIVRGDMSFIGPRPERPEFVHRLEAEIPHYRTRLLVPPGLTGWAQVKGDYAGSVSESIRKLEYDLYYVRNRSVRLDLQIVVGTVFTVLGFRGR